jgi:hypothetical protein
MNFQVLTAVTVHTLRSFGVVTPCSLVGEYWRFRGTCCLHFQCWNVEDRQNARKEVTLTHRKGKENWALSGQIGMVSRNVSFLSVPKFHLHDMNREDSSSWVVWKSFIHSLKERKKIPSKDKIITSFWGHTLLLAVPKDDFSHSTPHPWAQWKGLSFLNIPFSSLWKKVVLWLWKGLSFLAIEYPSCDRNNLWFQNESFYCSPFLFAPVRFHFLSPFCGWPPVYVTQLIPCPTHFDPKYGVIMFLPYVNVCLQNHMVS